MAVKRYASVSGMVYKVYNSQTDKQIRIAHFCLYLVDPVAVAVVASVVADEHEDNDDDDNCLRYVYNSTLFECVTLMSMTFSVRQLLTSLVCTRSFSIDEEGS